MTSSLHEAIAAVRAGDVERAQLIAASIVQDNPTDANAWYLMSQLVDSDARRAAYLGKTLTLQPNHQRALAEFSALPSSLTGVLAPRLFPVDGMVATATDVALTMDSDENTPIVYEPLVVDVPAPELSLELSTEWSEETARAPLTDAAPALVPSPLPYHPVTRKNSANQALTVLLAVLMLLTTLVLGLLLYLLLFS